MAKRVPFVAQMELADCGAACLSMVLGYHGHPAPLREVREATGTGRGGVDALRLVDAATHYGLIARGVRADVDQLHLLPPGSILHWGPRGPSSTGDHYTGHAAVRNVDS